MNSGIVLAVVDDDPTRAAGVSDISSSCGNFVQLCFISITEVEECLRVGCYSGGDEEGRKGEEGEGGAFRRFVLFVNVLYYSHNLTTPFLTEFTEQ